VGGVSMIRAIVVDDEIETREGLRDFVPWEELGVARVEIASDGMTAIELAKRFKPDIIISDIRMPRMNGIEFAERISAILPSSKLIFISGYSDKKYLKSAIHLKAISYVEKPLNLDEMIKAIKDCVDIIKEEIRTKILLKKDGNLHRDLVLRLVNQNSAIDSIERKLSEHCADFLTSDRYCTLIFKMKEIQLQDECESDILLKVGAINEALDQSFPAHLTARIGGVGIVALLCDSRTGSEVSLKHLLRKLMDGISRALGAEHELFLSVGTCVRGLENIKISYHDALAAADRLFFTGYGAIVFSKAGTTSSYSPEATWTEDFDVLLRSGDTEKTHDFLNSVSVRILQHQDMDVARVRNLYFTFSMKIHDLGIERGLERCAFFMDHADSIWHSITERATFQEVRQSIRVQTENYFSCIESAFKNKPVYDIMQYIEVHFPEKDLTVTKIASSLHFTASHICHIFIKETGYTMNNYITQLRIDKAKSLLKLKQVRIHEVSGLVGYGSANYFARSFKEATGISPSEYRNKYLV
jgi:two-component system, response regulator YesN